MSIGTDGIVGYEPVIPTGNPPPPAEPECIPGIGLGENFRIMELVADQGNTGLKK
jgi:hypothetical protein